MHAQSDVNVNVCHVCMHASNVNVCYASNVNVCYACRPPCMLSKDATKANQQPHTDTL